MPREADLKVGILFIKERTSFVKYGDTCYSISQAYTITYTDSSIEFEECERVQLKGKVNTFEWDCITCKSEFKNVCVLFQILAILDSHPTQLFFSKYLGFLEFPCLRPCCQMQLYHIIAFIHWLNYVLELVNLGVCPTASRRTIPELQSLNCKKWSNVLF